MSQSKGHDLETSGNEARPEVAQADERETSDVDNEAAPEPEAHAKSKTAPNEAPAESEAVPETDADAPVVQELEPNADASEQKPNIVEVFLTMYAFVVMILMWGGGIVAVAVDDTLLNVLWERSSNLSWPVQAALWVLLLPAYVSLWIWQADWPIEGRIAGLVGICLWTALITWRYIDVMLRERRLK